eukprot:1488128-Heterocapsa_arctica.AAC.1
MGTKDGGTKHRAHPPDNEDGAGIGMGGQITNNLEVSATENTTLQHAERANTEDDHNNLDGTIIDNTTPLQQ